AVRPQGPASPGAAGLQREETRLPQLPAVLPGGRHQWGGRARVEPAGRRLPADRTGARLTRDAARPRRRRPVVAGSGGAGCALGPGLSDNLVVWLTVSTSRGSAYGAFATTRHVMFNWAGSRCWWVRTDPGRATFWT